jgi:hypothetical protein
MNKPLQNTKYEHFAQLVSNGESPTAAYVLAGYSENGAAASTNRLLKNANVCERIAYLRSLKEKKHEAAIERAMDNVGISKEWVLSQLVENVMMAKAAEPVKDSEGNNVGEYKQNLPAANKALELIGTELGMFITKIEKGGVGEFERLSDAELEKRIADNERAIKAANDAIRTAATPTAKVVTRE